MNFSPKKKVNKWIQRDNEVIKILSVCVSLKRNEQWRNKKRMKNAQFQTVETNLPNYASALMHCDSKDKFKRFHRRISLPKIKSFASHRIKNNFNTRYTKSIHLSILHKFLVSRHFLGKRSQTVSQPQSPLKSSVTLKLLPTI